MLSNEQLAVLPDWVVSLTRWNRWGDGEIELDCQCDVCLQRKLIVELATALLARQRDQVVLKDIVEQLEKCEYECIAGPLHLNTAFIALKEMADEKE